MDRAEWSTGHFHLGQRVTWRGVVLVCTTDHYAGANADHPWDPGVGWPPSRAAALWAPDGDLEEAKLAQLLAGIAPESRMGQLMRHVTRCFPPEAA